MTGDKPVTAHVEDTPAIPTSVGRPSNDQTVVDAEQMHGTNEKHLKSTTTNMTGSGGGELHRKKSNKVDLVSNTNARLANPLGDLTEEEVMNNAEAFAKANNLPVESFRKGGLLAKSPNKFESMSILNEDDKIKLRREITHKYDQPFILYNLVVACSVAAAVQGMDESVISGAQLFFPQQFVSTYSDML